MEQPLLKSKPGYRGEPVFTLPDIIPSFPLPFLLICLARAEVAAGGSCVLLEKE